MKQSYLAAFEELFCCYNHIIYATNWFETSKIDTRIGCFNLLLYYVICCSFSEQRCIFKEAKFIYQ